MYQIGDYVKYMWTPTEVRIGKIVGWHHDEGNVWEVTVTQSMNVFLTDDEITPAHDAYGHPWSK